MSKKLSIAGDIVGDRIL